jgi:glycosyltransferase involved in cell wall biosynthesis
LERHKGIGFLLDVWESWEDKGEARLEIAGAGTMEKEIRRRTKKMDGVSVLGKLDRDGMFKALTLNAFLVFPSTVIENAPATIMESLSRGTPVVAASVGGVPEIVIEGQTGFLFRPGDGKDCLAALRRAAAQLPEWGRFFENCMRKASELSLDDHVEKLLALYGAKK